MTSKEQSQISPPPILALPKPNPSNPPPPPRLPAAALCFGICMKMRDIYCRPNGTDPDVPQVVQAADGICMTNRRLREG